MPIYAGVRARVRRWIGLGVLWCAPVIAGWVWSASQRSGIAGALVLLGWVGGAATSFVIRSAYDRRMASPLLAASELAQQRLRDREQARQLARHNPALARELGVGRPDLPGAPAAGLVDVNNASAGALGSLPGVEETLATRIVETRAQIGGFSSVEDLGIALDLPGDLVERLRDHAVFLPR